MRAVAHGKAPQLRHLFVRLGDCLAASLVCLYRLSACLQIDGWKPIGGARICACHGGDCHGGGSGDGGKQLRRHSESRQFFSRQTFTWSLSLVAPTYIYTINCTHSLMQTSSFPSDFGGPMVLVCERYRAHGHRAKVNSPNYLVILETHTSEHTS